MTRAIHWTLASMLGGCLLVASQPAQAQAPISTAEYRATEAGPPVTAVRYRPFVGGYYGGYRPYYRPYSAYRPYYGYGYRSNYYRPYYGYRANYGYRYPYYAARPYASRYPYYGGYYGYGRPRFSFGFGW